jgi:DNA-binding transcriptional regulator YiaG
MSFFLTSRRSWSILEELRETKMAIKTGNPRSKRRRAPAVRAGASRALELPPAGVSVRSVRHELGLTQELFARLAGCSVRTLADWESGNAPAGARAQRMIEIRRLREALARVIRPDFIGPWLQSPNEAFSGLKPIEVIERGEVDRIWRMIYELESGMPT